MGTAGPRAGLPHFVWPLASLWKVDFKVNFRFKVNFKFTVKFGDPPVLPFNIGFPGPASTVD